MTEKTWGGKREGAGRKPSNTKTVWVRLTDEQHEKLKKLGGSTWLQNVIEKESKMTSTEIIKLLKDEIKDAETRSDWQKRALEVLEDGQALKALGIEDEDQEAVECAYDEIKNGTFDMTEAEKRLYEALWDDFDRYSNEDLIDGRQAQAYVTEGEKWYFTRTENTKNAITEGMSDQEIGEQLEFFVKEAIGMAVELDKDDWGEAQETFRQKYNWL